MAGSDAVVDVSNVCWSSALPPLGKRSPVWGRLELVIDAWRQLHGPDVKFHLLADESLVHILDDPSGLGELQASGTLITSPVADTKILQLARDHDLHVITRDHFIDYRSAHPWIEQHPDRFHSWETEGGVVNIVPLGISPRSLQEISMAFEVRDLKRTGSIRRTRFTSESCTPGGGARTPTALSRPAGRDSSTPGPWSLPRAWQGARPATSHWSSLDLARTCGRSSSRNGSRSRNSCASRWRPTYRRSSAVAPLPRPRA